MMMNLSRKRSASPLEDSPVLTGQACPTTTTSTAPATQEELEQLTAMRILKRQRLAQAAAAAEASALFRPSLMDMNMPMSMQAAGLYGGMNMNAAMNMNMNAAMNPSAMMFHPGATAARLRLGAPLSPFHQAATSTASPMSAATPFAWRAAAMNSQGADCLPHLPSMPQAGHGGRASSPDNASLEDVSVSPGSGLEQLSAFASHMPTMPVPRSHLSRKPSLDPPTKATNNNTDNGDLLLCAPIKNSRSSTSGKASPPPPPLALPLKTMQMAKKLEMPVMDTNPKALHWEDRPYVPLAINEDANWLSEFQCFLRSEILEVFIASPRDLETRAVAGASKKKIASSQVGIRCRFCAHLHPTERASRASAFPSSVRQIYQSFTMMLREHLNGQCEAFPQDIKQHFIKLKGQSAQSASDSKRYWIYAAQKLGMVDTPEAGIQMNPQGRASTKDMKPFGTSPELEADLKVALSDHQHDALATQDDQPVVAEFTYTVVSQAVRVHLAASEKIGNRSCLTVGLPGLACKHCALQGRSGLSRVFPARKRNLKTKVHDLYDHLRRCELTPKQVKEQLQQTLAADSDKKSKVFYARLWRRLGHENDDGSKSPTLEATRSANNISPIPSSSM